MCVIPVVGVAPCQCFSPGENRSHRRAEYALQREINKRLSGELDQSELHEITCVPFIAWTADGNQSLNIMPPNLRFLTSRHFILYS